MIKHLDIKISGLVQGVFFRASAKEQAESLSLVGFAKNDEDRSVYIEVEGSEKELEKFIGWCKKGPSLAQVEKVEVTPREIKNFTKFEIY